MNAAFQNMVRAMVTQVLQEYAMPRWGFVTSVNPSASGDQVKIRLEPESTAAGTLVESGWLPVTRDVAASNTYAGGVPAIGTQVFVLAEGGFSEHGVVVGAAHNDGAAPPDVPNANGTGGTPSTDNVQRASGEYLIVDPTGNIFRLGPAGVYVRSATGTIQFDSTLKCNGDVFDRHGSLDRLRGNYDAHKHPGVQIGGASTGTTDHPDPE